jgi:hypothetical protein
MTAQACRPWPLPSDWVKARAGGVNAAGGPMTAPDIGHGGIIPTSKNFDSLGAACLPRAA